MEILIVGYLSLRKLIKDFVIDPSYIKSMLSYFENNQISPNLLAELNKNVFFFLSKYINNKIHLLEFIQCQLVFNEK